MTKAMELRLKNQWFELAANRKASSIVLTLAFDPNEPVSIFEYCYRRFGEKLAGSNVSFSN